MGPSLRVGTSAAGGGEFAASRASGGEPWGATVGVHGTAGEGVVGIVSDTGVHGRGSGGLGCEPSVVRLTRAGRVGVTAGRAADGAFSGGIAGRGIKGVNFLRWRRLRMVTPPDPSTRTTY